MPKKPELSCSFCSKPQRMVEKLIAGPTVYICNECIMLCNDIIRDEMAEPEDRPTPRYRVTYWDAGMELIRRWGINEQFAQAIPPGWVRRVERLLADLEQLPGWDAASMVAQIKTKFAGLRFYTGHKQEVPKAISNQVFELISKAEQDCRVTCEDCGSTDRVVTQGKTGGWLRTLCPVCLEERVSEP